MAKGSKANYIIYPEYFDLSLSRSSGRRVPKSLAVPDPRLDDLMNICRKLGLSPEMESDKPHPAFWHESRGRLKVAKKYPKERTLKLIAERLIKKA